MRMILLAALTVTLAACGGAPAEPDDVSQTIEANFKDCMPGLKASDIKRISDRRYSVMTDKYATAWAVERRSDGTISTRPWEGEYDKFKQWGCF